MRVRDSTMDIDALAQTLHKTTIANSARCKDPYLILRGGDGAVSPLCGSYTTLF